MKKKRSVRKVSKKSAINIPALLGWILLCEAVGIIGSFVTFPAIPTWYQTLVKPSFSPPNWLFGPVWTTLYLFMGIAAYRISQLGIRKKPVMDAMILFAIQLIFNALWSPIFFGTRNITLGLIDIVFLWGAILVATLRFRKLDEVSAWLFVPYLAWVSFATVLNFHLWLLNVL